MLISYAGAERKARYAGKPAKVGNYRGRPRGSKAAVFSAEDDATIIRLYREGAPYVVIGAKIGQPRTNVFKRCRHLGLEMRRPRWEGAR